MESWRMTMERPMNWVNDLARALLFPLRSSLVSVGTDVQVMYHSLSPPALQIEWCESGQSWLMYALVEYWRFLALIGSYTIPCLIDVSNELVMLRMLGLLCCRRLVQLLLLLWMILMHRVHLMHHRAGRG